MSTSNDLSRRYWIVSPNVKYNDKTIGEWRNASLRFGVAFMGWEPDNYDHGQMGPKFAGFSGGIKPGDVILIARRHDNEPDIVGFGVVRGDYEQHLKGFKPPENEQFGSLRKLRPFKPWSRPPQGVPLIDALGHTMAMVQLHPEKSESHNKVCDWMDRQLRNRNKLASAGRPSANRDIVSIVDQRKNPQLDYQVQTKAEKIKAEKTEFKLLQEYARWLEQQGRKLSAARYGSLECDGYEKKRGNLIEAKSSIGREHIRMAVGQILDYAFQGRKKFGDPKKALLLPKKPAPVIEEWLKHLEIALVWREGDVFLDNANGQFS
jgi:hypothetical protein